MEILPPQEMSQSPPNEILHRASRLDRAARGRRGRLRQGHGLREGGHLGGDGGARGKGQAEPGAPVRDERRREEDCQCARRVSRKVNFILTVEMNIKINLTVMEFDNK